MCPFGGHNNPMSITDIATAAFSCPPAPVRTGHHGEELDWGTDLAWAEYFTARNEMGVDPDQIVGDACGRDRLFQRVPDITCALVQGQMMTAELVIVTCSVAGQDAMVPGVVYTA